jgi:polar amino acid transport system substrate-binding protein
MRIFALIPGLAIFCLIHCASAQESELTLYFPAPAPISGSQAQSVETNLVLDKLRAVFQAASITWHVKYEPMANTYEAVRQLPNSCAPGVTPSIAEIERLAWVGTLWTFRWSLLARAGLQAPITKLVDARGYRIGVVKNSPGDKILRAAGLSTEGVTRPEQNLDKLLDGRIDFWFSNEKSQADLLLEKNAPPLRQAYLSVPEKIGLACSVTSNKALMQRLSETLGKAD